MRISDWSSDVCSSDLVVERRGLDIDLAGENRLVRVEEPGAAVAAEMAAAMLGRCIDFRSPADLERILPAQTQATKGCPAMGAAIAPLEQGWRNDFGRIEIIKFSAMTTAVAAKRHCHEKYLSDCLGHF